MAEGPERGGTGGGGGLGSSQVSSKGVKVEGGEVGSSQVSS